MPRVKSVKVLPLKKSDIKIFRLFGAGEFTNRKEISPVFNRDGYYYDRITKTAWVEILGRAFEYSPVQFMYELSMLSHKPLRDIEFQALKTLVINKKASKEMRDLYFIIREWRHLRAVARDTRRPFLYGG